MPRYDVASAAGAVASSTPKLILDTNLFNDVGDVAFVSQAVLQGDCECLAMVAGTLHPSGASGIKVLLDYALPGHNILVGQYNGTTLNSSAAYNGSVFLNQIVSRFGSAMSFPNHVASVRKALSVAHAKTVTYVLTGYASVLIDVLGSLPDSNSPLSGQALFREKVKAVYWRAGTFSNGTSGTAKDFVFGADPSSARTVLGLLASMGIPCTFAGLEVAGIAVTGAGRVTAAPPAGTNATTSPFEYAYDLLGYSASNPSNAWSMTALYPAIYGSNGLFGLGGNNGTVTVNADGSDSWSAVPAAGQSYLVKAATSDALTATFNAAIAFSTGNHVAAGGTWGYGAGMPVALSLIQAGASAASAGGSTPTTPTTTPTGPATSVSGSTLTSPVGQLIDANLNTYALKTSASSGLQIYINGTLDPPTAQVVLLLYYLGHIYQKNATGDWYGYFNGVSLYQSAGDPRLAATTPATTTTTITPGPLNSIATPALAAWGLRRLRTAWTSPIIQVQRDSDSATLNVGCLANGDLDTTSLANFAGQASVYVVQWYDQSGNGYHLANFAANNGKIVTAGVLNTVGLKARPAIVFNDSAPSVFYCTGFPLSGPALTVSLVAAQSQTNGYKNLVAFVAGGQQYHYDNAGSAALFQSNPGVYQVGEFRNGTEVGAASIANQLFCATVEFDGANATVYIDQTTPSVAPCSGSFGPAGTLNIGSAPDVIGSTGQWAGPCCEVILHQAALSSGDRATLRTNEKTYFGTP